MERYTLGWIQSPDTFIDAQDVVATKDGGAEATLVPALPSSAALTDVDLETGSTYVIWIRTIGDNGKHSDSPSITVTAANEQVPLPASGLTATWKEHLA